MEKKLYQTIIGWCYDENNKRQTCWADVLISNSHIVSHKPWFYSKNCETVTKCGRDKSGRVVFWNEIRPI